LIQAVRWLPPHVLPRLADIHVDGRILAFTVLASAVAGLAVGLLSAPRTSHPSRHSIRTMTPGRPSDALVVAEVAAAIVLLVAGGLLLNSSVRLARVPMGIDARGVVSFGVSVPLPRYRTLSSQEVLYDRLTTAWRQLPGVTSVAMGTDGNVLGPSSTGWPIVIRGRSIEDRADFRHVSPGFFQTLGIHLRRGREFDASDKSERPRTVVVSEGFARKFFGGIDVVGERIGFDDHKSLEIVGVAADVRPAPGTAAEPTIYFPVHAVVGLAGVIGVVRTSADPLALLPEIRRIAGDADPSLVVYDVQTVEALMARSTVTSRFYAIVSAGFALLATILAAVGLYGVLAHSVAARTRELGIRTAVGATPRRVIADVMRRGLTMTAVGIVIGLAGAVAAARTLTALLYGVTPADAATFASVTVLFAVIAALACFVPARRATRIDPVLALKAE
jgi:predicted permease